jgi:tRNA G18 (ribose-2'-O)-methylase SpoU
VENDFQNFFSFTQKKLNNGPSSSSDIQIEVLCDNIRSPFNVGSIIRSAECFAFSKVLLWGISANMENAKLQRASQGAEAFIPVERFAALANLQAYLGERRAQGYNIIAVEKTPDAQSLADDFPHGPSVIIMGNEEFGVSQELLALADKYLMIPILGHKNSLNVGTAFGIIAYRFSELSYSKSLRVTVNA